jgi:integrase
MIGFCYVKLFNRRGKRMDRHCATRRLQRLKAASVVRLPRMLRHTFVTTMLDAERACGCRPSPDEDGRRRYTVGADG